jgi:hypothetical protein
VLFAKQKWSIVACVLAGLMLVSTSVAEANKRPSVKNADRPDPQVVAAVSSLPKQLRKIAKCESGFRQFKNGKPLRNKGSSATGVFQIMYSIHADDARALGFNINTIKGNIGFAKHLYRNEGTRPWNPSKHCWSKLQRSA